MGDIAIENTATQEPPSYLINICCCKCCRKDEVSEAKLDLFYIVFDWFMDAAVGAFHLSNGAWVAGILTYLIILISGVMIIFISFSLEESRIQLDLVKDEISKMSPFYGILMYIPSFFPICSAKLRWFYAIELKKLERIKNSDHKVELENKMTISKDQALWDNCCESFFENIPQAVLQIVIILKTAETFSSLIDYFPIGTIFLALYGITVAPIRVMTVRHKDIQMGHAQRLTAYASNALRVLACALFVTSILTLFKSADWITDTLWTLFSALVVFFLLDGPWILQYELGKCYPTWSWLHQVIVEAIGFIVILLSFYLWGISQIHLKGWVTFKVGFVIASYLILMFFTCAGLLLYKEKLDLYHSVSKSAYLSFYLGVKAWVLKVLRTRKCCQISV